MIFSKWHGLGNDFILVDMTLNPSFSAHSHAIALCDRHRGIGADGLVTIKPLSQRDVEMRIFNADGSEAEMCGNASRCVGMYIRHNIGPGSEPVNLHTRSGIVRLTVLQNAVRVDMGEPRLIARNQQISLPGMEITGTSVSMGNPHFVVFVPSLEKTDITALGPALEKHPLFPNGTNVEFAEIITPEIIRMRVWERGCGITMACGTGSCATAFAGLLSGLSGQNATLRLDGGDLQITCGKDNHIHMTGPATEVFRGSIDLQSLTSR